MSTPSRSRREMGVLFWIGWVQAAACLIGSFFCNGFFECTVLSALCWMILFQIDRAMGNANQERLRALPSQSQNHGQN